MEIRIVVFLNLIDFCMKNIVMKIVMSVMSVMNMLGWT